MRPSVYDAYSTSEESIPLPAAEQIRITDDIIVQPPLTRRGTGPGLIVFLPNPSKLKPSARPKALDPEPIQKFAEDGFSVAGVTMPEAEPNIPAILQRCWGALAALPEVDDKDKLGVIIYDGPNASSIVSSILQLSDSGPPIVCLVAYGYSPTLPLPLPVMLHFHLGSKDSLHGSNVVVHEYKTATQFFVLPQTADYDPGSASVAHSRTLAFLKGHLDGPYFNLEAIWDEHTYFEFEVRSVAKTMSTMVAEPYVNHIPTMTGGVGRQELFTFYRDHFIFSNPDDATLEVVSRTVGVDRVVDEFIFHVTHNRTIDWLLPGLPPSGNKLSIPMLAVVNIRGDRLYHEHIWWDQGTVLQQAGLLPTHLQCPTPKGPEILRLPIAGAESAVKLLDETGVKSNAMLSDQWRKKP